MSVATATETVTRIKLPSMFKVILLNDDTTPVDFVVQVIKFVFEKDLDEAKHLANRIHAEGRGVVGIYTLEIARQKVEEVGKLAKAKGYPLRAIKEEA